MTGGVLRSTGMLPTLAYDTLPVGSRIERQFEPDGGVILRVPAHEPGEAARRQVVLNAALAAAPVSALLVIVCLGLLLFVAARDWQRWDSMRLGVVWAAALLFCGALFAMVWRAQFQQRLEHLQTALAQQTVLRASPGRLLVETDGPLGHASHDLRPAPDRPIRFRLARLPPQLDVTCMMVIAPDGSMARLLPGLSPAELDWVARTVRERVESR